MINSPLEVSVKQFCAKIGKNSLLVQGAGGNVSWKDSNVLNVKASGKWLANAESENIFVSVSLDNLNSRFKEGNFAVKPVVLSDQSLRPSIEILLHAMMPQPVVVHVHAVEVLALLVRDNCTDVIDSKLGNTIDWAIVDYVKPGEELASEVFRVLQEKPELKLIFLKNHGIVIGGSNVEDVDATLSDLVKHFLTEISTDKPDRIIPCSKDTLSVLKEYGYTPAYRVCLHSLALDSFLITCLEEKWALFPDHVVFLGPEPVVGVLGEVKKTLSQDGTFRPPYLFVKNIGVFQHQSLSKAQEDQLVCYLEVLLRQSAVTDLICLSDSDIDQLLNWDAEKYRQSISI